jgi:protein transport protein SEC20
VDSAWAIDKLSRENLFSNNQQNLLRKRKDQIGALKISSQITDKLLDISKYLAETTQRSAETLDTLGLYFI